MAKSTVTIWGTFYCRNCKRIFREDDVQEKESYLAEAWGRPIYEKYYYCPECGDEVGAHNGEPYEYDENGDHVEEDDDDEG